MFGTLRAGRRPWLLVGLTTALIGVAAAAAPEEGPERGPRRVPDQYVVQLSADAGEPLGVARGLAARHGLELGYVYHTALRGFSCRGPREAIAALSRQPGVVAVVPDIEVQAFGQTLPTGINRADVERVPAPMRIDEVPDAADVDIAILDTGIGPHTDLRVVGGADFTGTGSYVDDNGHGTHVAGTAAALDDQSGVVGVCPGARLWAVKVLDARGSGTLSGVTAGVDWVASRGDIEVLNMSLGARVPLGSPEAAGDPLEIAVRNASARGVHVVVAAGNSQADAFEFVPARYETAVCVSALDPGDPTTASPDRFAWFSNYGSVVDVAAPGVGIYSTLPRQRFYTMSGTSMASPHVAGAVARYLLAHPGSSPAAVLDLLRQSGEAPVGGWEGDPDGLPEKALSLPRLLNVSPQPWAAPPLSHNVDLTTSAPTCQRGMYFYSYLLVTDNLGRPVTNTTATCQLVDARGRINRTLSGPTDAAGQLRCIWYPQKNDPVGTWTLQGSAAVNGVTQSNVTTIQIVR